MIIVEINGALLFFYFSKCTSMTVNFTAVVFHIDLQLSVVLSYGKKDSLQNKRGLVGRGGGGGGHHLKCMPDGKLSNFGHKSFKLYMLSSSALMID